MTRRLLVAALLLSTPTVLPAERAPASKIDVPAGPLAAAVVTLGIQAGVSVGVADPQLANLRVGPLKGRFAPEKALRRLLAGSAAELVVVDDRTFRIVRGRDRPPSRRTAASEPPAGDIVVTGSKRAIRLQDYPGSVATLDVSRLRPNEAALGTDALVAHEPTLASTHLGPGRDKLFIRGIADSSFNGPSQSTVGEYLGDVRLNYNAPDPHLALYDIERVEILEGPQGTLYGAGALGGILRLVPAQPDLAAASGSISAGGSFVEHGGAGHDVAASANVPLVDGRLGIRAVAYENIEAGYVDDHLRGLRDVNRSETYGGRATLRYQPASDWRIDLGGAIQNIFSRDGQYAQRGLPPLVRESAIAQPFDNDYALADLVVRHDIGRLSLVSATSAVFHDVGSTFDASPSPSQPTRYVDDDSILLIGNETRLSRRADDGSGWVAGGQFLHSRSRNSRTLGAIGSEPAIAGTVNTVDEASVYGEGALRLASRLFGTAGGRIAYDHLVGHVVDEAERQPEVRRGQLSALPSVGLLWKAAPRLAAYARYQRGYRPGGLSVQAGRTQRFEADSVSTWEIGARYGSENDVLSGTAAASYARWSDIQSDLVDEAGLPYTTNVGSGRVLALEARASWRPAPGTSIRASLLANHSALRHPAAAFAGERDATLPNIADVVARLDAGYELRAFGRLLSLSASASYVGKSRLAVGPDLDFRQGRYLDLAMGASLPIGRCTASLDVANIADTRRNTFAFGNPFTVRGGDQVTPLRPRTIRLGFAAPF